MKLTFLSEVRTARSLRPVRLSGVFVDAVGCVKGLTVLRVLPDATPVEVENSAYVDFRQPIYSGKQVNVGVLEPFWWQSSGIVDADFDMPISITGGAMTCLFTLTKGVMPNDERWLMDQAKIAVPNTYVDKPVRLAEGVEIGVIVDELNQLSFGGRSVYPLLKLRRSKHDKKADVGTRNGAMVFAQDGAMIGVIVATFGEGEFYSVAPIEDIMEWHGLSFMAKPTPAATETFDVAIRVVTPERSMDGSAEVLKLLEDA